MLSKVFPETQIAYEVQETAGGCLQAAGLGLKGLKSYEGNVMVIPGNMPLLQANTTLLCLEAMVAEDSPAGSVWPL